MTTFTTLYKKTSTGAIQYWRISVIEDPDHSTAYQLRTEYGQVGTDNPQTTVDFVTEGKNIGKANETTVEQQAHLEATSKFESKLKDGYVRSINMPRSEVWFHSKYNTFRDENDQLNIPFAGFIPDLINKKYKYIVEVDGSYHDLPEQKTRDKLKDEIFSLLGYLVVRVLAYNDASYEAALKQIQDRRTNCKLVAKGRNQDYRATYEFSNTHVFRYEGFP